MSEKRFKLKENLEDVLIEDMITQSQYSIYGIVDLLNEQQSTIEKQELVLQHLEELLELSENLNKSYREKLIDMNLKMVIDDE